MERWSVSNYLSRRTTASEVSAVVCETHGGCLSRLACKLAGACLGTEATPSSLHGDQCARKWTLTPLGHKVREPQRYEGAEEI